MDEVEELREVPSTNRNTEGDLLMAVRKDFTLLTRCSHTSGWGQTNRRTDFLAAFHRKTDRARMTKGLSGKLLLKLILTHLAHA